MRIICYARSYLVGQIHSQRQIRSSSSSSSSSSSRSAVAVSVGSIVGIIIVLQEGKFVGKSSHRIYFAVIGCLAVTVAIAIAAVAVRVRRRFLIHFVCMYILVLVGLLVVVVGREEEAGGT